MTDTARPVFHLRVHGRLRSFLAPRRRHGLVDVAFDGAPAVKDPIESVGIPHVEVASLCIDHAPAALTDHVHGGESVDVCPFERQSAGTPPRFLADEHLGRLARYLRLVGIDTATSAGAALDVSSSVRWARVLLSRNVALLKRRDIGKAAFVYAAEPTVQLAEVITRFDLHAELRPFTRCAACNGAVEPVDAAIASGHVPPRVLAAATHFSRCPDCSRIYWRGTHEDRFRAQLAQAGVHLP